MSMIASRVNPSATVWAGPRSVQVPSSSGPRWRITCAAAATRSATASAPEPASEPAPEPASEPAPEPASEPAPEPASSPRAVTHASSPHLALQYAAPGARRIWDTDREVYRAAVPVVVYAA